MNATRILLILLLGYLPASALALTLAQESAVYRLHGTARDAGSLP